jgi:drug/metabolite transporter (DMT)-like permease
MTTFRLTAAVVVIAMQYTAAVWIFLFNWLIKKQFDKRRIVIMTMIIAAILLFVLFPVPYSTPWGNWLALAMGILFAIMAGCLKKVRHDNPIGLISVCNFGTAILVLPLCFIIPGIPLYIGATDWLFIVYLAIFQLSAGYIFFTLGIKKVTPQKATLLSMWEFVLTPVWAFLVVREVPTTLVWVACALLIGALIWDNRLDKPRAVIGARD